MTGLSRIDGWKEVFAKELSGRWILTFDPKIITVNIIVVINIIIIVVITITIISSSQFSALRSLSLSSPASSPAVNTSCLISADNTVVKPPSNKMKMYFVCIIEFPEEKLPSEMEVAPRYKLLVHC